MKVGEHISAVDSNKGRYSALGRYSSHVRSVDRRAASEL